MQFLDANALIQFKFQRITWTEDDLESFYM